jgi:hypothetical protein
MIRGWSLIPDIETVDSRARAVKVEMEHAETAESKICTDQFYSGACLHALWGYISTSDPTAPYTHSCGFFRTCSSLSSLLPVAGSC